MTVFVLDTQVVKGYFHESVLGKPHALTGSTLPLFSSLTAGREVFLDDRGQIRAEWASQVEREWFDVWVTDLFRDGKAMSIPVTNEKDLRRRLKAHGFPERAENLWFMRTAAAVVTLLGSVRLITEDLDYYEPKEKQCGSARRLVILTGGLGRVRRELRDASILVLATCNAL